MNLRIFQDTYIDSRLHIASENNGVNVNIIVQEIEIKTKHSDKKLNVC